MPLCIPASLIFGTPTRRAKRFSPKTRPIFRAEHQAKVFASAFLIHDEDATGMTAEEISIEFGVSLEAAKICIDRLKRKAERATSAEPCLKDGRRGQGSASQKLRTPPTGLSRRRLCRLPSADARR